MYENIFDNELRSIKNFLKTNEMNDDIYTRIANIFKDFLPNHSTAIDEILKDFVFYTKKLIFVNEIRIYKKQHNTLLYKEYGKRFKNCKGCLNVFDTDPTNIKEYDFKIAKKAVLVKEKTYIKNNKRGKKNWIKKEAIQKSMIDKNMKEERKSEKAKEKARIYAKLRKQDL